jgi:hypothetical protein
LRVALFIRVKVYKIFTIFITILLRNFSISGMFCLGSLADY